jgi:hypothetical protein
LPPSPRIASETFEPVMVSAPVLPKILIDTSAPTVNPDRSAAPAAFSTTSRAASPVPKLFVIPAADDTPAPIWLPSSRTVIPPSMVRASMLWSVALRRSSTVSALKTLLRALIVSVPPPPLIEWNGAKAVAAMPMTSSPSLASTVSVPPSPVNRMSPMLLPVIVSSPSSTLYAWMRSISPKLPSPGPMPESVACDSPLTRISIVWNDPLSGVVPLARNGPP